MTSPFRQPAPGEWIRAYARVQVATDQQVISMLADAHASMRTDMAAILARADPTTSDAIRYQQMAITRKALLEHQATLLRELGEVVEARRLDAAARAIQVGNAMDAYVLDRLGRSALARETLLGLTTGLAKTTEVALARMGFSYTELSQRIYNNNVWLGGRIDRRINTLLAQGKSAREFAAEAVDWFDPNTPGGVRYAAMRLARSEINNAFHAVAVQQAQDKPWVDGMKWHLSGSHPKPDICDEYAHEDKFKRGPGVFPKEDVPRKPHPHCYCYVVPTLVDEDAFLDNLVDGKYDKWIADQRAMQNGPQPKKLRFSTGDPQTVGDKSKRINDINRERAAAGLPPLPGTKGVSAAKRAKYLDDHPELLRGTPTTPSPRAPTSPKPLPKPKPAPKPVPAPRVPAPEVQAPGGVAPARISRVEAQRRAQKLVSESKFKATHEREIVSALTRQAEISPEAFDRLRIVREVSSMKEIRVPGETLSANVKAFYSERDRMIVIRGQEFSAQAVRRHLADVKSGWHSRIPDDVAGWDSDISHEFGHHIASLTSDRIPGAVARYDSLKPAFQAISDSAGIRPPFFFDETSLDSWVRKNADALSSSVSKYGAHDSQELLAEVWAEYTTNPNMRPHIREAGDVMLQVIESRLR